MDAKRTCPEMDAELKARWIAALRGGEYQQGSIHLRNGDRFCCLGVLYCAATGNELPSVPEGNSDQINGAYDKIKGALNGHKISAFTNMNDCEGKSFAEIADYIEKHL